MTREEIAAAALQWKFRTDSTWEGWIDFALAIARTEREQAVKTIRDWQDEKSRVCDIETLVKKIRFSQHEVKG